MKNKIILFITALLYLSFIAAAAGVDVTIFVNNSVSGYPASVGLDSWTVSAWTTMISSIDPTKLITSKVTNTTGHAVLSLTPGTYYITSMNYDTSGDFTTPLHMGTIMDTYTSAHILDTSSETSSSINDYTNASAIRGYVKDTSGAGLNGGKVYISGTYRKAWMDIMRFSCPLKTQVQLTQLKRLNQDTMIPARTSM
jgi:hypothetical protein